MLFDMDDLSSLYILLLLVTYIIINIYIYIYIYIISLSNYCRSCLLYEVLVGTPPFESVSADATMQRISDHDYDIPGFLPKPACDLIVSLLQVLGFMSSPCPVPTTYQT